MSSTYTERKYFLAVNEYSIPIQVLSPNFLRARCFRSAAPTVILPIDVRINVFQVVPQDLVFYPMLFYHRERGGHIQTVGQSDLGDPELTFNTLAAVMRTSQRRPSQRLHGKLHGLCYV